MIPLPSRLPAAPTLALAPAALPLAAPAALSLVQIVGAGLVAASSALFVQRNYPAARQAMAELAGRLSERLRWTPAQTAAATRYLQVGGLEQLVRTGGGASAIAALASELSARLPGITALSPPPPPTASPQPRMRQPPTSPRARAPQEPSPRPPTAGPLVPPTASERSNPASGLQSEANALQRRVAELQQRVQVLDQTRTLSAADIGSAGRQRTEWIANIRELRGQIRALDQRAATAMAHGLSALDYVGLNGQLQSLGATLAGLERSFDTAMTHALQRAVARVEGAIANGDALPFGAGINAYRQLANHLHWFSQQAGASVFSDDSRRGFEARVATALLPATGNPPREQTTTSVRPRGPATGSSAATLEEEARRREALDLHRGRSGCPCGDAAVAPRRFVRGAGRRDRGPSRRAVWRRNRCVAGRAGQRTRGAVRRNRRALGGVGGGLFRGVAAQPKRTEPNVSRRGDRLLARTPLSLANRSEEPTENAATFRGCSHRRSQAIRMGYARVFYRRGARAHYALCKCGGALLPSDA